MHRPAHPDFSFSPLLASDSTPRFLRPLTAYFFHHYNASVRGPYNIFRFRLFLSVHSHRQRVNLASRPAEMSRPVRRFSPLALAFSFVSKSQSYTGGQKQTVTEIQSFFFRFVLILRSCAPVWRHPSLHLFLLLRHPTRKKRDGQPPTSRPKLFLFCQKKPFIVYLP